MSKDKSFIVVAIIIAVISALLIVNSKLVYLAILASPFLIYLCIEKPFVCPFGLYILLIPFDNFLSIYRLEQGPTITRFIGILTMIILLFKGLFEKKLIKPDSASLWWMIFILYVCISFLWAIDSNIALSAVKTIVGLFLFYIIVASYKIQQNEIETLKLFILIGGCIVSFFLISNYVAGDISVRTSLAIGHTESNPNAVAFSLLIPFAVSISIYLENKLKIVKVFLLIIIFAMILSFIITGSRGGMLGLGTILIIYITSIKNKMSFWMLLLIAGIIILTITPAFYFERWSEAVETGGSSRTDIWYVGFKALEKYWLLGAGIKNFSIAFNEYLYKSKEFIGYDYGAHNFYVGNIIELGIIGFSLFIWAMLKHYKSIQPINKRGDINSVMLKAAFCGILVSSFFGGDKLFVKSFWLLLMFIAMNRNLSVKLTS